MSRLLETTIFQWEEGYRKLQAARSDPQAYRTLGRLVVMVEDELRKRLGSSFSIDELACLYREDTDWPLELTTRVVPEQGPFPDSSIVVDAAFYLYMREAVDFAGGSLRAGAVKPS